MTPQQIPLENLACGEGALWDFRRNRFVWTDAAGQAVYASTDPKAAPDKIFDAMQVGSIALHRDGGLVLAGAEGAWVWREDAPLRWLAREIDGRPVRRINEVLADPAGRLLAAQEVYEESTPYEPGALFLFDPNGYHRVVETGVHIGNGMAFSPDQRVFYFTDSFQRSIYAYDYDVAAGTLSNRRTVVRLPVERGLPDGLAVDSAGYLWTACWFGGGVARFDPDGTLERFISVPATQVSSVAFGGKDRTTLWITSAAIAWETRLYPPHFDGHAPRGGGTFAVKQDIVGQPEFVAAV